jgi:hypothetical protein
MNLVDLQVPQLSSMMYPMPKAYDIQELQAAYRVRVKAR